MADTKIVCARCGEACGLALDFANMEVSACCRTGYQRVLCDSTSTRLTLTLDADDLRDVLDAIRLRRTFISGIPDGGSCDDGAAIAEVCRGWREFLGVRPPGEF